MTESVSNHQARVFGFHRVTDNPNPALLDWAISPVQLDEQMKFLSDGGYEAVTCTELMRRFAANDVLDRVVAISFDDGYLDTVTVAAPILARYGFVATVFAVAGLLGKRAEWDAGHGEMAALATAAQLRTLADQGWEIGHHTITHAGLTQLSDDEIRREVLDGLDLLTNELGITIQTFAYPFTMQDSRVRALMVDTPFAGIFAAGVPFASPQSPREAIERVFVLNRHTLDDFQSLLNYGMDLEEAERYSSATDSR